jgi:hypothetical protein
MTNQQSTDALEGQQVHQAPVADLLKGVVGVFDAPHAANEAFEFLLKLGYQPDEVGILIAEFTKRRFYLPSLLTHPVEIDEPEAPNESTPEGEAAAKRVAAQEKRAMLQGAGAVSAIGALGGLLVAGATAVFAPPLGLSLLGPLAGMGAGFGAMVGGVYGVPTLENELAQSVTRYEAEVQAGRVLIQVTPHSAEDEALIRKEWDRIQGAAS